MKLDLGAGAVSPDGFTPLGSAHGSSIFPLPYGDGTVDEIRASHCLEHFPHSQTAAVLKEWVRVLKPGGNLKVAVPDFGQIASGYLSGQRLNVQGYVMGGQVDDLDYHKAVFDAGSLKQHMASAGLMLIRQWTSELEDCAALPISLNLEGTKPHYPELSTVAVMSMPRLAWTANAMCWIDGLIPLGISPRIFTGAFWEQCLERAIEETLEKENPDLILTLDYDTVFTKHDVAMLIQLMACYPFADAIAPVQSGRGTNLPLFTMDTPKDAKGSVPRDTFAGDLARIRTAHFGLTMIRSSKLASLAKPWLRSSPAPDGTWGEGRQDADISFWRAWDAAGNTLYSANRVAVGHLEVMIRWPGEDLLAMHQDVSDWRKSGPPKEVWK